MIDTTRLEIIPLMHEQLEMYAAGNDLLETEWGLKKNGRTMLPAVQENVKELLLTKHGVSAATADFIFFTFWLVIEKASKIIVAEIGFKGLPVGGSVEVGYGTMPGHEGNGYMTEAVAGVLRWATHRKDIAAVLASIHKHNTASLRVVEKNDFELFDQRDEIWWWRKETDV